MQSLPQHPTILEIGSWEGASATYWAEHLRPSVMTCVDTWQGSWEHAEGKAERAELRFDANMKTADCRVEKIKETTFLALPRLIGNGQKFDFVYVDASHTSYHALHDLLLGLRLLRVGGVMAIDDYEWGLQGVAEGRVNVLDIPRTAIDCFLKCYAPFITVTKKGYQVWLTLDQDFTLVKSLSQTTKHV